MNELGFQNVDWRKGTGLKASPADSGRDIVAELARTEFDGSVHIERWFVDCKHHERGVPPTAVESLLTWAMGERPHVVLVIASGYLSNPCKDYLKSYEMNNRPPFRIKHWERPQLQKLTKDRDDLARRHLMFNRLRTESEVAAAETRFASLLWYDRRDWLLGCAGAGTSRELPDVVASVRRYKSEIERRLT